MEELEAEREECCVEVLEEYQLMRNHEIDRLETQMCVLVISFFSTVCNSMQCFAGTVWAAFCSLKQHYLIRRRRDYAKAVSRQRKMWRIKDGARSKTVERMVRDAVLGVQWL